METLTSSASGIVDWLNDWGSFGEETQCRRRALSFEPMCIVAII